MNFLNHILPTFAQLGLWGYWVILLVAFFESLISTGAGALMTVLAGFLAARGILELGDLIWFAALGAILGNTLSYYLGSKGRNFFREENKILKAAHLERGESFFHKHGGKSILLVAFVGPLRAVIPFVAGCSKMDKKKFLFWTVISAFLWATFHLLIGYFFGGAFSLVETWTTRAAYLIGIFVLLFIFLYALKVIVAKEGKRIFAFLRSISSSVRMAIIANPEVQKMKERHPRIFTFLKKRLNRASFFGLSLTLISLGFIYAILLFLGTVEDVFSSGSIVTTDLRIVHLMAYFRNDQLTQIFFWITDLGRWQVVAVIALAASFIFWMVKKNEYIFYLWLALASCGVFSYLGKIAFHRPRPVNPVYLENSFSFPSGHAMVSIIFYGFLGYILMRHLKRWKQKVNVFFACVIIAAAIGFSRLYLGVHYWSDVWGGYLLGLLILAIIITMLEWRMVKNNLRKGNQIKIAMTPMKKIASVVIIMISILWYIGFALNYHVLPANAVMPAKEEFVFGDIISYFSEHQISKYSETLTGDQQEPLSFIFLAKDDDALIRDFEKASWFSADKANISSLVETGYAAVARRQYLSAPMTPSFWNAAVHDFGFEKPTDSNTVRQRHHIRIWKTNLTQRGYSIYVGTASLDEGIKWFITHRISPDIDTEREFVREGLQAGNVVMDMRGEVQFVNPTLGKNFSNDPFFTDGNAYIIVLK